MLIVSAVGEDPNGDYFEIPLEPPPDQAEVEDELEIEYEDNFTCAFTLAFATNEDGLVSDYTPITQVIDAESDPCP